MLFRSVSQSRYDVDGVLNDWWIVEDRKVFDVSTVALIKQYDVFEFMLGMHVNGVYTLGENIADFFGFIIVFKVYHYFLVSKLVSVIDGFIGDQCFFLGYAQIW